MIEVSTLAFTYRGATEPAIADLTFHVEPGEIFGFLGPSGAGKSTTQKILVGLLRDFEGTAKVTGRNVREWMPDDYERVGVGFEFPNLYLKLTALENLRYFGALYSGEIEDPNRLLELVGLGDDGTMRVSQFSKGMKSRLGFARALLNKPEMLFLDEPTAGLDPVNARNIKDIIAGLRGEGRTIFLTTHDMTVADELCDRVAFIVDGGIRVIDAPRTLKLQHGKRAVRVEYTDGHGLGSSEFPLDGLGSNAAFIDLLRDREIETIHTLETTLEQVFISVTGRVLE